METVHILCVGTEHSFMLWPSTKVSALFYDNRIRMANERRNALISFIMQAADTSPDLRLHVRRDHLIRDAVDNVRSPYSIYFF